MPSHSPRIPLIHRVVEAVAVPVPPHPRPGDLEPIRLDEHAQFRIVVPGVEVLQARRGVIPRADPALGLGRGGGGREPFGLFAERLHRQRSRP